MTEENKPERKEWMLWRPAALHSLFSFPCYVLSFSQIKATWDFWEEPCLTSHGVKHPTALMAASATDCSRCVVLTVLLNVECCGYSPLDYENKSWKGSPDPVGWKKGVFLIPKAHFLLCSQEEGKISKCSTMNSMSKPLLLMWLVQWRFGIL